MANQAIRPFRVGKLFVSLTGGFDLRTAIMMEWTKQSFTLEAVIFRDSMHHYSVLCKAFLDCCGIVTALYKFGSVKVPVSTGVLLCVSYCY